MRVLHSVFHSVLHDAVLRVALAVALLAPFPAQAQQDEIAPPEPGGYRAQIHSVPVQEGRGHAVVIPARICRPLRNGAARLVVINHGSPERAVDRLKIKLGGCEEEAPRWFLERGYVVALPLRRGYGEGGGVQADDSGECPYPDFVRAGVETARDIDATVRYARGLPFVRRAGAVIVGQSAGGWGAIAYDALPHPSVAGFVVMAGGRGGHYQDRPFNNCRPDLLVASARRFGHSARTPMLWIYTENDSYFSPGLAHALWEAFTGSGGVAELQQLAPFDDDGHQLFYGAGGSSVWGPIVARYLKGRGLAP